LKEIKNVYQEDGKKLLKVKNSNNNVETGKKKHIKIPTFSDD
jgi:sporulation protein YlmC with PRC-barrel domain